MRKVLFLFLLSLGIACDSGDFEVPSFEFNDTINSCGNYVLYRTNDDKTEALIISLTEDEIKNEISIAPIRVGINTENVQYRIFDAALGDDYFCADVPPVSPSVIRNWTGTLGSDNFIVITTTAILDDNDEITGYNHAINLENLVLESNGESQIFETYFFGNFTTNL